MSTDWRDIPIPEQLADRPKDERGFPITFVTLMVDGKPDFTTIDAEKIVACITGPLCGLCGQDLIDVYSDKPETVAFIGGPKSIEHHNFLDPPMHEECAAYAMQVCPHIVHDTSRYKKQDFSDGVRSEIVGASDERPDRFGMMVTTSEDVGLTTDEHGQPIFLVDRHGAMVAGRKVEVRWQGEPQYDDDGEELFPYFETRVFRIPEHEHPDGDGLCLETVVATHGRHRKSGDPDRLIAMMCPGCSVLHQLVRVTDPEEIERLRNPSEEDA